MRTKLLIFVPLLFVNLHNLISQSISTEFKTFNEIIRRNQLLGEDTIQNSFMNNHSIIVNDQNKLQPQHLIGEYKSIAKIWLLPFQQRIIHSSGYPYKLWNEGAFVASKGTQSLTSFGLNLKVYNRISIQIRPEYMTRQNLKFDPGTSELLGKNKADQFLWLNRIDNPLIQGVEPIRHAYLAQSSVSIDLDILELSFSNRTNWWGPGKYTSLLMSDNARGFNHVSLHTPKPLETLLGNFEAQIIAGQLNSSKYAPGDTSIRVAGAGFYVEKPDDDRYISGINLTYQPKWIKGLSIGYSKVVYQYVETAKLHNDYVPVFTGIFNRKNLFDARSVRDKMSSISARWVIPEGHTEFYFEYGFDRDNPSLRDFFNEPQVNSAYLIGFSKLIPLNKGSYLELNAELTRLQQPPTYAVRNVDSWYIHDVVRHGYTHDGEVIGVSTGPGSNVMISGLSWIKGFQKIGLQFERITHNNDFYYYHFHENGNYDNFWVDYSLGTIGHLKMKQFLIGGQVLRTWSLNYDWGTIRRTQFFEPGNDKQNWFIRAEINYLFNFK